jgi:hypothetical protein
VPAQIGTNKARPLPGALYNGRKIVFSHRRTSVQDITLSVEDSTRSSRLQLALPGLPRCPRSHRYRSQVDHHHELNADDSRDRRDVADEIEFRRMD